MVAEPVSSPRGRVPPQDIEAERSVLGALLLEPSVLTNIAADLRPDDFYRPAHGAIYEAMLALFERSEPVDEVTVRARLKDSGQLDMVGGTAYLASLTDSVPTAANVDHYVRIVRSRAVSRRLIQTVTKIAGDVYDSKEAIEVLLDEAEARIFEVTTAREHRSFIPMKEVVKDAFSLIERRYERKDAITGVASGFADLDAKTAGWQPSDLIILAGRPSMGKTAVALNMAQYASLNASVPVAVFSLEMSRQQLVMRMLCSEGRIDSHRLRSGFLKDSDWPKLARAAGSLAEAKIFLDDSGTLSILDMRAKSRRLQAEHGLGLVIVDYLQLMTGRSGESREREISEISRGLKALAKELNVPVIALSQLNRSLEQRVDKRPMLSDLRESGALEQDADVIVFVYRDEYYNQDSEAKGQAELIIGKQRNGPTGTVQLKFFHEYTRFENLAKDTPAPQ